MDSPPEREERKGRSALEIGAIILGICSLFTVELPIGCRIAIAVVVVLMFVWELLSPTLRKRIIGGLVGLVLLLLLLLLGWSIEMAGRTIDELSNKIPLSITVCFWLVVAVTATLIDYFQTRKKIRKSPIGEAQKIPKK